MLEKVVLLIEENILQKKVLCGESILLDDLRGHGVGIVIGAREGSQPDDAGEKLMNTLYITDSDGEYHRLKQQGKYVLPYRYEENRSADFAGALYVIEQIEEVDFETIDMAYRRLACLPWDILTTKRCMIRETTVEDVDSFYEIYAEPDITEYMEDLYADRDAEIAYVEEYRKKVYEFYGYGMWTVLTKDGIVIGRAGISWREGFDLPELGFVIGVPWQRQGYANEVCRAILDYAQEELGFTQVQALVMEGNEKSAALCVKLGFEESGNVELEGERYVVYRFNGQNSMMQL
ncbi:MAG: GNAT family N-acetyltransferase [Lachnospiraceae bacterium]|nr:GNAT family N-acetyltransferase [Lachnospiraceae bacterium]